MMPHRKHENITSQGMIHLLCQAVKVVPRLKKDDKFMYVLRETLEYSINILASSKVLDGKETEERIARIIPCLCSAMDVFPKMAKECLEKAVESAEVTWT